VQLRIKQKHKKYAINGNKSLLCGFGLKDIRISESPHKNELNYTYVGKAYQFPPDLENNKFYFRKYAYFEDGIRIHIHDGRFYVKQLEVFHVTLRQ
jgi:hypothetical protein